MSQYNKVYGKQRQSGNYNFYNALDSDKFSDTSFSAGLDNSQNKNLEVKEALRDIQKGQKQSDKISKNNQNCLKAVDMPRYNMSCYSNQPNGQQRYLKNNVIGDISPEEIRYADYLITKQSEKQKITDINLYLTKQFESDFRSKEECLLEFIKVKDKPETQKARPMQSFTSYQEFLYPDTNAYFTVEKWEHEVKKQHEALQQEKQKNPNEDFGVLDSIRHPQKYKEVFEFKPEPAPPLPSQSINLPDTLNDITQQDEKVPFNIKEEGTLQAPFNGYNQYDPNQYKQQNYNNGYGSQFSDSAYQYSSNHENPYFGDMQFGSWDTLSNQLYQNQLNQQQYGGYRNFQYPAQAYQQQGYPPHQQPPYQQGFSNMNGHFPQRRSSDVGSVYGKLSVETADNYGNKQHLNSQARQQQLQQQQQQQLQQQQQIEKEKKYVYLPIYDTQKELLEKKVMADQAKLLEKYNSVDVCFILDATNSMQDYIDSLKNQILDVVKVLREEVCRYFPDMVRIAYICYRDEGDDVIIQHLDFTNEVDQFKESLGQVRAYGGTDIPEDMISAIEIIPTLSWNKNSQKVICHISDAPCHGDQFHGPHMQDRFQQGDYRGRNIIDALVEVYKLEINHYQFYHVERSFTGKMIQEFKKQCVQHQIRPKWFQEINEITAQEMGITLASYTLSSISSSMSSMTRTNATNSSQGSRQMGPSNLGQRANQGGFAVNQPRMQTFMNNPITVQAGGFQPVAELQMNEDPVEFFTRKVFQPNFTFDSVSWDRVRYSSGATINNERPTNIDALLNFIKYQQPLTQFETKWGLKIHRQPFSESGACRYPFYAIQEKKNQRFVVKQFRDLNQKNLNYYIQQMEISTIAEFMQRGFYNACNHKGVQINPFIFLRVTVFLNKIFDVNYENSKTFNADNMYNLEKLLPGNCVIEKFNSNFGHVNYQADPNYNDQLQAFSHWTYVRSQRTFLLVDLQGTFDETSGNMVLTDPAIHCPQDKQRFARTNLAEAGIMEFLKSHKCNSFCRALGIFDESLTGRSIADQSTFNDDEIPDSQAQAINLMSKLSKMNLFNYGK